MSMPELYDVNFDAMDESDLKKWLKRAINNIKGRNTYLPTLTQMVNYAQHKIKAMTLRKSGDVANALIYEGDCDKIYEALPNRVRW